MKKYEVYEIIKKKDILIKEVTLDPKFNDLIEDDQWENIRTFAYNHSEKTQRKVKILIIDDDWKHYPDHKVGVGSILIDPKTINHIQGSLLEV